MAARLIHRVTVAQPAANTQWTYTLPAGHTYRLLLGRFSLVTDANAANRTVFVQIQDDASLVLMTLSSAAAVVASTTQPYNIVPTAAPQLAASNVGGQQYLHVPQVWLPGGYKLLSAATNFQVGDRYSVIELLFERTDAALPVL